MLWMWVAYGFGNVDLCLWVAREAIFPTARVLGSAPLNRGKYVYTTLIISYFRVMLQNEGNQ
jgi:hypothetical protein